MSLVLADRVQETTTTVGTGTLTLDGAVQGFQSFTAVGNGNTTYYTIQGTTQWEVGIGTYSANTLTRDTVISSSTGGTKLSLAAGTKQVFVTLPASVAVISGTDVTFTKVSTPVVQATNSAGLSLKNASGTTQLSMGAGGGDNLTLGVSTNINGANAQVDISPTGTGHVHIKPTGAGSVEVAPTNTGTLDNLVIGGVTPKAITGTTITATTFSGSGASLTSIPNAALTDSSITINGVATSLGGTISVGTVTSVGGTGTVSGLTLTGSVTGSGNLTLGGAITGFAASGANTDITSVALTTGTISTIPTNNTDIVNKQYADAIASGIHFHEAVALATTAALPANTYNNGTSGVGATLTATANGALSVDSTLTIVAERILVKNEVTGANNGVYVVTQVGSAGTPYILTRATDFDTVGTGVDQIDEGDFFLVTSGTANVNTAWVQQTPPPITIGTTALVFQQFAAPITYTAGTGLNESPSFTFNIANTGTAGTYGSASQIPVFTTNAQGQVTSVTNTPIAVFTPTIDRLTSTQQSTSTALADVTQLVEALVANATYSINCFVTFQSAATTTGLNLGFTSPTGCVCAVEVVVPVTTTAAASQLRKIFPNAADTNTGNVLGTGVSAINTNQTARISGIITNGANAGNFQVRFATEVNASAITLQTSSVMVLERLV